MDIKINYCSVWNYKPRAAGLAEAIKKEFGITPELIPGSNGVYDIIIDKKTIFSKHEVKRFPENDEIIALINKWFYKTIVSLRLFAAYLYFINRESDNQILSFHSYN